jgi:initiation factor 1A
MVKNNAGGNKGKGLARKHVNAAKAGASKQLRVATDEAERYAVVSKMLGNGMCYVRLLDGSTGDRLCIIRNKFKGRGKRDNILDSGSWVLVGMREWASKQDTCDLLEVYNANERDRLIKNEPCFRSVSAEDAAASASAALSSSSNVQFTDNTTLKYSKMVNKDAVNKDAVNKDAVNKDAVNKDAEEDDDDDEVPMQQRVYDMPSSSDEDEDDEDDEDDEEEEKPVLMPVLSPVPVSKPKPKLPKFEEINVDDI